MSDTPPFDWWRRAVTEVEVPADDPNLPSPEEQARLVIWTALYGEGELAERLRSGLTPQALEALRSAYDRDVPLRAIPLGLFAGTELELPVRTLLEEAGHPTRRGPSRRGGRHRGGAKPPPDLSALTGGYGEDPRYSSDGGGGALIDYLFKHDLSDAELEEILRRQEMQSLGLNPDGTPLPDPMQVGYELQNQDTQAIVDAHASLDDFLYGEGAPKGGTPQLEGPPPWPDASYQHPFYAPPRTPTGDGSTVSTIPSNEALQGFLDQQPEFLAPARPDSFEDHGMTIEEIVAAVTQKVAPIHEDFYAAAARKIMDSRGGAHVPNYSKYQADYQHYQEQSLREGAAASVSKATEVAQQKGLTGSGAQAIIGYTNLYNDRYFNLMAQHHGFSKDELDATRMATIKRLTTLDEDFETLKAKLEYIGSGVYWQRVEQEARIQIQNNDVQLNVADVLEAVAEQRRQAEQGFLATQLNWHNEKENVHAVIAGLSTGLSGDVNAIDPQILDVASRIALSHGLALAGIRQD